MTKRAFIAPDERSWLVWGHDLRAEGFIAAAAPASADVLVAPERVPESLSAALREAWDAMPMARELVTPADPVGSGEDTRVLLRGEEEPHDGHDTQGGHHEHHDEQDMHGGRAGHDMHGGGAGHDMHGGHDEHDMHGGHDEHDMHGDHGGHDHHAMMAVTGDPSADGLVMEDLEFELGPLAATLPGGLVARLTLDGDVVCKAELVATLDTGGATAPDPTAASAWRAALAYAEERAQGRTPSDDARRERLVAVELERAVSHAGWVAGLGDLLGWPELGDAGRAAALAAMAATRGDDLAHADAAARSVANLLGQSRRLRFRLGGLAPLILSDVDRLRLAGPNARAAGLAVDARTADPAYTALGFTPVVEKAGDAAARARLRARELVASVELVRAARTEGSPVGDAAVPEAVEGPRGPLAVHPARDNEGGAFVAQGADVLLAAVSERLEGLEWSAAMAAIASFDVSGWKVTS